MKCSNCLAELNPRWTECVACGWPVKAISFESEVDEKVLWLNSIWKRESITMNDITPEQQKRASYWEAKMTSAAEAGRVDEARMALEEWRCCWVPDRCYPLGRPRPLDQKDVGPEPSKDEEVLFNEDERAAILEYDGGLPRAEAERLSRSVWCHRRKPPRWVSLAVCEWHLSENDPVCKGCQPEALKWKECIEQC
jgi:hypothetical protein